jgi:folylpolyglutamate synthase/dihydropteroate synthase
LNNYLEHIINQLTIEEVAVLGILKDQDATAVFKSLRRSQLYECSDMSVATFRKTIDKLKATSLVDLVTARKEHKVYLTTYGIQALEKSLQGVREE